MTKAQKQMKYIGAAYFILALSKVVFGGLIIWIYARNFSFHGNRVLGAAILSLSFHIIVDVLCWSFSMEASKESSHAGAALTFALFCILGNVCYCINHVVLHGISDIFVTVPWISLTLYVLTVLTALRIRQKSVVTEEENVSQISR